MDGPFQYYPGSWPLLATVMFQWGLGLYGWTRRSVPGAAYFALVHFLGGLVALFSALQLLSADIGTQSFWWRLQVGAMALRAPGLLCFSVAYARLNRWLTRRNLALLAFPPLVTVALILTNDPYHWLWTRILTDGPYLRAVIGPGGWAYVAYVCALHLASLAVMVWLFARFPLHRLPAALIVLGQLVPFAMWAIDVTAWHSRWPLDPVILTGNISAVAYALAFFRFRVFSVVPLARELVVERMDEGMVVVDAIGRIADLNPSAQSLLGAPRASVVGREVREVLGSYPSLRDLLDDPDAACAELSVGSDACWYEVHRSPLVDPHGLRLGDLLLLRDVTEQKQVRALQVERQRQSATLEERRRLARDLHDDLSQELGFINVQLQAASELLATGRIEQARSHLVRLVEVARGTQEKVRELISELRVPALPGQGFACMLRCEVEEFGRKHGMPLELRFAEPSAVPELGPSVERQLLKIVHEALVNVRRHAGANCVRVILVSNSAGLEVAVEDDGLGFDPHKVDGAGKSFGLRIMAERAAEVGGTLDVFSEPGRGTRVTAWVPGNTASHELPREGLIARLGELASPQPNSGPQRLR